MPFDLTLALQDGPFLLDGAMGTALQTRGLPPESPPEEWIQSRPEEILAVHEGYLLAGADCIQTNTFGANRFRLQGSAQAQQIHELNLQATQIACAARDAAPGTAWVAGCMGPLGLERDASPPDSELVDAIQDQARGLLEGGVDLFHLETMGSLDEASLVLKTLKQLTELPILVSFTLKRSDDQWQTLGGDSLPECFAALADAGALALGANCSTGSANMLEATPLLLKSASTPVLLKPNAGQPQSTAAGLHYSQDPAEFAHHMSKAVELGAAIVGGCCGTDERFIAALREILRPGDSATT